VVKPVVYCRSGCVLLVRLCTVGQVVYCRSGCVLSVRLCTVGQVLLLSTGLCHPINSINSVAIQLKLITSLANPVVV